MLENPTLSGTPLRNRNWKINVGNAVFLTWIYTHYQRVTPREAMDGTFLTCGLRPSRAWHALPRPVGLAERPGAQKHPAQTLPHAWGPARRKRTGLRPQPRVLREPLQDPRTPCTARGSPDASVVFYSLPCHSGCSHVFRKLCKHKYYGLHSLDS